MPLRRPKAPQQDGAEESVPSEERIEDAPPELTRDLPQPIEGKFVLVDRHPALAWDVEDGAGSGPMWAVPTKAAAKKPQGLEERSNQVRRVVRKIDYHYLIRGGRSDAKWLPEDWEMDVYPIGKTLTHLEGWFKYALDQLRKPEPDGCRPPYVPTHRQLFDHTYLLVKWLGLPDSPSKPIAPRDASDCRDELQSVRDFFRRALAGADGQEAKQLPVIWQYGERSYALEGAPPIVVSVEHESILREFKKAKAALNTRTLEKCVANVARVMKQISKLLPGAVRFPSRGRKGTGYYIDVRDHGSV
jgi:hypothetical protein